MKSAKGNTNASVTNKKKAPATTAAVGGGQYNNAMVELLANPYTYSHTNCSVKREIQIHQFFEFGIGGVLWDCGLMLGKYITHPHNMNRWAGKVVVEVGTGTGLPALLCWQLGAKAIATDLGEVVEAVTNPNVAINLAAAPKAMRKSLSTAEVRWGEDEDCARLLQSPPVLENKGVIDFIIAADVVYRSEDHAKLLRTLDLLASDKTCVIFVHRPRNSNDSNFCQPLREMFIPTKTVPGTDYLTAYPKGGTTINEFQGRQTAPKPSEEGE
ncbi:methyltransferase family 16, putative [Bodo saltans]|uniref:Methyltransferase family 16, putative n=1 Tax=Bodo saltans TaxID=75058 RepID=A0A0S4J7X7_BODSA|nr:methyltransferase family 16, putative [Bodo saltans]|eukprot:CUG86148.1 methyltransferase family 16, putative [Bodo saltans]